MRSDGGWRRVRGVVGWVGKRLVSLNGEGGIAREGDIRSDKHVGRIGREGAVSRPGRARISRDGGIEQTGREQMKLRRRGNARLDPECGGSSTIAHLLGGECVILILLRRVSLFVANPRRNNSPCTPVGPSAASLSAASTHLPAAAAPPRTVRSGRGDYGPKVGDR